MASSKVIRLAPRLTIRTVTAPFFLATKLEAFKGRGKNDFVASHDLEDLIAVVDGRAELVAEVRAESDDLREYLSAEIRRLLESTRFLDALPAHLLPDAVSQSRVETVIRRLRALTVE